MTKTSIAVIVSALFLVAQYSLGIKVDEATQNEVTQAIGTIIAGGTVLIAIGEKVTEKIKARKKDQE